MARLVLLSEGFTGRTYDLKAEKTTVGRVSDNTFEIPEASISSHHAELILKGGDILVRDLGSTNGSFINGEKITEAVLKPGQILRLGVVEMRLETGDAALPKKVFDQTRVIPQGVKSDELTVERAPPDLKDKNSAFSKKSNKAQMIFIIGTVAVGLVLLALLMILMLTGNPR
ncbi:MAG: FHA domain-containing protein [Verrucomicrobia bacterium]|nr:FHA domain-containing protein [Verrucomicrobiota bacterium]